MKFYLHDIILFVNVSFVLKGELQRMITTNYLGFKFCFQEINQDFVFFDWEVSMKGTHPCLHKSLAVYFELSFRLSVCHLFSEPA